MKRLLITPIAVLFFMVGCEEVGNKQAKDIEALQKQFDRLDKTIIVDVDKIEKVQDMILDRIGYSVVKAPYESEHYILVPNSPEDYTVHGSSSDECPEGVLKEGCE